MKRMGKSILDANNGMLKERPYKLFDSIIIHTISYPQTWVTVHSKEH